MSIKTKTETEIRARSTSRPGYIYGLMSRKNSPSVLYRQRKRTPQSITNSCASRTQTSHFSLCPSDNSLSAMPSGLQLRGRYGERFARTRNGERGPAPSGVQGQSLVRRRGEAPTPEAERHSLFRCPEEGEIWPVVKDFSVVLTLVQQIKCFFSTGALI